MSSLRDKAMLDALTIKVALDDDALVPRWLIRSLVNHVKALVEENERLERTAEGVTVEVLHRE